jgi:hypothetical protein
MSRRKWFILIAAVLFIGVDVILLVWWFMRPTYSELPLSFDGSSDQLQHTVIVPTLDTPIPEGKNAIWCASFQIAWNKLKTDVTKGPVLIQGAEEIAERLNKSPVTEADLPDGSYYAAAGLVKDGIVERIQREMAERFPGAQAPAFDLGPPELVAVAYGLLQSELRFAEPFNDWDKRVPFEDSAGSRTPVAVFGIQDERGDRYSLEGLLKQVDVLFWTEAEYAVQLRSVDNDQSMSLALIPRPGSLADALAHIEGRRERRFHARLGFGDRLAVPVQHWRARHRFREIEGKDKMLLSPNFNDCWLDSATQMVQFRLDKRGASLTSEAELALRKNGGQDREFLFNRPFLIVLKKRDAANPFFVMWVDNAELLQKWGK